MIAIAHVLAISCYLGAAVLAAAPFVRPLPAPVRGVVALLAAGVAAHLAGLAAFSARFGQLPLTGIGPALSLAGLLLAATLLVVEVLAREVSLTLFTAPLAALVTAAANIVGLLPGRAVSGVAGIWIGAHTALSFLGIASFAAAAGAGTMYLVERRELKSRRFGAIFRFFPPLATLDRVNHVAALAGWLALTVGIVLAVTFSLTYGRADVPHLLWGLSAWVAVTALTVGRVLGGWQARRAAVMASASFAAVLALYLVLVIAVPVGGQFL